MMYIDDCIRATVDVSTVPGRLIDAMSCML